MTQATETLPIARLLQLDAEWKQIDRDYRRANDADEKAVLAGELDKEIYLKRALARQEAADAAKQALERRARAILNEMTPEQVTQLMAPARERATR